jgi:hypothetical protein
VDALTDPGHARHVGVEHLAEGVGADRQTVKSIRERDLVGLGGRLRKSGLPAEDLLK